MVSVSTAYLSIQRRYIDTAEGGWEGERLVQNPEPPRRCKALLAGLGLSLHHRCREANPAAAEEDEQSEA